MKLDWGMLANHAEVVNNLAYVHGGGIDTVNVPSLPGPFTGAILLRFLLHRTEMSQPHKIEIRIQMADGQEVVKLDATIMPQPNAALALGVGVFSPTYLALNIAGLQLPKEGSYSVEILADGVHVQTLPFSVKLIGQQTR